MANQIVSLVTGGAGFIGSHVAEQLIRLGHEVVILDDLSGGSLKNVPKDCEFIHGSICDNSLVESLFEQHQFNYVYHCAAYAAEGLSHFIRRFNYENNLIGTVNLINASVNHNINCFVFTSSIAVYGSAVPPVNETMPPTPEDPYGIAKFAVELDLQAAKKQFGLNYIIFRPHNVYGEGQNINDKYRNVIGIFLTQALQGKPLTVFGDGSQTRAFSYIGDIAKKIADSVNTPGAINNTFNIGSDHPISVLDLATMIGQALKKEIRIEFLEPRNEVEHAYAKHEKINTIFGDAPETPLHEGIARMAAWAEKEEILAAQSFENIEIEKNLPLIWKK